VIALLQDPVAQLRHTLESAASEEENPETADLSWLKLIKMIINLINPSFRSLLVTHQTHKLSAHHDVHPEQDLFSTPIDEVVLLIELLDHLEKPVFQYFFCLILRD
jgi:hypothetical protein